MRTAILSDIHSNPIALEKAIKDARENHGADSIVCLGDVVGYGTDPIHAIDIVRNECKKCVIGNHEAGIIDRLPIDYYSSRAAGSVRRHQKMLKDKSDYLDWMNGLPYTAMLDKEDAGGLNIALAHGSLDSPQEFEYITCSVDSIFSFVGMECQNVDVLFVGHVHEAMVIWQGRDVKYDKILPSRFPYETVVNGNLKTALDATNQRYIINVGSVGYPRNQPSSVYCIFDSDEQTVEHVFLPFAFNDYATRFKENNISIPHWLERQVGVGF